MGQAVNTKVILIYIHLAFFINNLVEQFRLVEGFFLITDTDSLFCLVNKQSYIYSGQNICYCFMAKNI